MLDELELTRILDNVTNKEIETFDKQVINIYKNTDEQENIEKIDYMYKLLWDIVIPRQYVAYKMGLKHGVIL